jgi:hypothetical protein
MWAVADWAFAPVFAGTVFSRTFKYRILQSTLFVKI